MYSEFLSHSPIWLSITCLRIVEAYCVRKGRDQKIVKHCIISAHISWLIDIQFSFYFVCFFDIKLQYYFLSSVFRAPIRIKNRLKYSLPRMNIHIFTNYFRNGTFLSPKMKTKLDSYSNNLVDSSCTQHYIKNNVWLNKWHKSICWSLWGHIERSRATNQLNKQW